MKRRKVTRPTKTWAEIKHLLTGPNVIDSGVSKSLKQAAKVETPWGDKSCLFAEALAQMSPGDRLQAWNDLVIYGTAMIWRPAKGKPVLVPPAAALWRELNQAKPKRGRK